MAIRLSNLQAGLVTKARRRGVFLPGLTTMDYLDLEKEVIQSCWDRVISTSLNIACELRHIP
jgi:hypothetical protein